MVEREPLGVVVRVPEGIQDDEIRAIAWIGTVLEEIFPEPHQLVQKRRILRYLNDRYNEQPETT